MVTDRFIDTTENGRNVMTTENIIHFDELFALIQKSKRAIANTKNESAEMVVALSQIETDFRHEKEGGGI